MKKKKIRPATIAICLCAAALIGLIVWDFWANLYPDLRDVFSVRNDEKIAEYIQAKGEWKGAVCIVLLSFVQVLSVFLPGGPIQIASGLVYVWWKAFILCYIGFLGGNILVYRAAKRRGGARLMNRDKLKAVTEKLKEKDPVLAVALANLIPGIPNGACPYLAASTGVTLRQFVIAVGATCWIQILVNCVAGHLFIKGQYGWSVFAYALEFAVTGLVWIIRKKKKAAECAETQEGA